MTGRVHVCPQCGSGVMRVHRHLRDRLSSLILRIHRYRCSSQQCGWEGVISVPPAPGTRLTWAERFARLRVGWPARVAWMLVGAICVVAPLEGFRYFLKRQQAPPVVIATSTPKLELEGVEPGDDYDGIVIGPVTVTPENPAPLERRKGCLWGVPGRNPYKGSLRQVLVGSDLPQEVVQKIEALYERQRVTDRVTISNTGIWTTSGRRRFDTRIVSMGFGKSLCFNTRVNFPEGHVEVGDLYETSDAAGHRYSVMVPYVCGNVAVLAERAERVEPVRSIPEPATWALALVALAAAWSAVRRSGHRSKED